MNVLLMSNGYRNSDDRTRIDLLKKLSAYCNFMIYGLNEYEMDKNFAPLQFNEKIKVREVLDYFKPDVILFLLYDYKYYTTIPKIIGNSIPRVVIEEDHYRRRKPVYDFEVEVLDWYEQIEIDLVVRRHCYQETLNVPSVWLPFSANMDEFYSNPLVEKINKIGFAGSSKGEYYTVRRKALEILSENGLLGATAPRVEDYPDFIRAHKGFLTCSAKPIYAPMAKVFEVMLCEVPLLTNFMYYEELLFGKSQCYFKYKDDCSNIVEQANIILEDEDKVLEVTKNALQIVKEKHTDEKRAFELYNILKALTEGTEIPKIWGQ
jgi:glycosyltransferase involved in cell wall biosynthesis